VFSDKMDAKRTLREILLLRNMDHPNVCTSLHSRHTSSNSGACPLLALVPLRAEPKIDGLKSI